MSSRKFIDKATQIILDNLSNEQFGVESLSQACNISRSQLFKKVKIATGKSASQFIRDVKLEEALKQLETQDLTVSEVSYLVGFSSHAYFTTCFKDYFGYSPSEVKTLKGASEIFNQNNKEKSKSKWLVISSVLLFIILIGFFITNALGETRELKEKTIAVIRFANMTDDKRVKHFADGLGEEIINSISKIHELKVIARNSSFQFNKEDDVVKIAKMLNVNYVLEGSIRKDLDTYRITIQLIDASDGFHLWSETYDRKPKDILFLQEDISRIVAHQLQVSLSPIEDKALSSRIMSDSLAYQLYKQSIKIATSNKIEDIKKGVDLMNRAIEADSTFSLAHARIVSLYKSDNFVGETDFNEATELMQMHVDKAFHLDPTLAEAYIAKGYLEHRKENYSEALNALSIAVEMAPNEPRAHFALSVILRYFNRTKEAYEAWQKAFELDPFNPQISLMIAQYYYYKKRDFEKGKSILINSINAYPDNDLAACHLEMYKASLPHGDLVGAFKNYFKMYTKTPNERRVLNFLVHATYWLDLKPMSEMLNNKIRLMYPSNIHTFWSMYKNNALQGRYVENIHLVKFWSQDQKLSINEQVNYLAESYINRNRPKLAKRIIEDSIPRIKKESFLINAENYDPQKSSRLDVIEKYIIVLRELGEMDAVDKYVELAVNYIDSDLERLSKDEILDYRYELNLKLMRASITDDVDKCIAVFEKAFFEDKHRMGMYDELITFARYYRFQTNPKFISFLNKVTNDIDTQRNEVIIFLKEEGYWESTWD